MDNDDFQDSTLTGAETSHRTNVMFVPPEDTVDKVREDREKLTLAKPFEIKEIAAEQHKIKTYKTAKRGIPSVRPEFDVKAKTKHHQLQQVRGMIHALARLDNDGKEVPAENQNVGVFAGFQAIIQSVPVKSKPYYYYLTLPKPPKKSVVYDVMCSVATVAKTKSMPFVLLVGDEPVYALIVQLKYENQELFDRILPFLGPFHTQCSFMSAINKRFNGSGLSDLLVAADVIAESSVDNALKGTHYKRSVRCFRLMYEVLVRRIIQQELNEGVSLTPDLKEKLEKLRTPSTSTQEERKLINDELRVFCRIFLFR